MSKLIFAKYEGAGNDFILIDDRALSFPLENRSFIERFCHRKFGVGADGIILLQNDSEADFRMRIFNSNGSEAESCGNGLRCLVRFIQELGFFRKMYSIAVGKRIVSARCEGERVIVDMGKPEGLKLKIATEIGEVHFVDTGVPHLVHFVTDLQQCALLVIGPKLRHHPLFQPKGVNVNCAEVGDGGKIRVRTFERGVEGETLACGTGAVAVAAIASEVYPIEGPVRISFAGGELEVRRQGNGSFELVGEARKVFDGRASSELARESI